MVEIDHQKRYEEIQTSLKDDMNKLTEAKLLLLRVRGFAGNEGVADIVRTIGGEIALREYEIARNEQLRARELGTE